MFSGCTSFPVHENGLESQAICGFVGSRTISPQNGFEAFICDAAQTPKRPFKWFIDNRNAGPFMNGRDGVGFDVNCDLDRTSAWLDDAEGVWFVIKANRDIAPGEWLMWKYNWMAGAGIAIPGLMFAFD